VHPILFSIGKINFYSYGFMVGIGFAAGVIVASRRAEKKGLDPDSLFWFFMLLLLSGVVGGRLFHLVLNSWYYQDWRSFFDFRGGGLSMHGVLVGGVIAMAAHAKTKGIPLGRLADIVAPSVILGQAFGRIGCFLNGCCYGIPTNGSWGFLTRYAPGLRHPYQLYESAADFMLFFVLLKLSPKVKIEGTLFLAYLFGYSVLRFFLEFFRDNYNYFLGLSYGQWACFVLAASAVGLYVRLKNRRKCKGLLFSKEE